MARKFMKRIVARYVRDRDVEYLERIHDPRDVVEKFKYLVTRDREEFVCLHLDKGNQILCWDKVSIGGISEAAVHPREVIKTALLSNATALIFLHNHPSERAIPSPEDRELTRRLKESADLFGIKILDHLILGGENHFSFRENGLL